MDRCDLMIVLTAVAIRIAAVVSPRNNYLIGCRSQWLKYSSISFHSGAAESSGRIQVAMQNKLHSTYYSLLSIQLFWY